jgi:hypothetical protein
MLNALKMDMIKQGKPVLLPPQTLDDVKFQNGKEVLNTSVRMGIGVTLLQAFCLTKTIADYGKTLDGDKTEAAWRLGAACLGIAGNLLETTGLFMKQLGNIKLPWAQGTLFQKIAGGLELFGKALGYGGAFIMAVWDGMKGVEEWQKENKQVAILFGASALLGLALTYLLATAGFFSGVSLLVLLLFVGVTGWLDRVKDNALHTWLENCVFGVQPTHTSAEHEMQQFKLAIS